MPDELAEDERVIQAATAGPWYTVESPWRAKYKGQPLPTYIVAGNPDPHIGFQILEAPEIEECEEHSYEEQVWQTDADLAFVCRARTRYPALVKEVRELRAALAEIAKGEGRYSMDPLKHCGNTVEDMKEIAMRALARPPEAP